jgi:hypothetical protein
MDRSIVKSKPAKQAEKLLSKAGTSKQTMGLPREEDAVRH